MPAFSAPDPILVERFLATDARLGRLDGWGCSTVVDENTGTPVIDEELFDRLHRAAGIDARFPVGNAGVVHVYGYWFSGVPTPYGYKRERWQDGELAAALSQPRDAFLLTGEGEDTPLRRVTEAALPMLDAAGAHASEADASGSDASGADDPRTDASGPVLSADAVVDGLRTRVVLTRADASSVAALVYGVRLENRWRLITTFPFSGDAEALVAEFSAEQRWRWNAVSPQHP